MRRFVPVLLAAAAVVAAVSMPTGTAQAASTDTTFDLTGGTIDISAPAGPVSLGSVAVTSTTVGGSFGTVAVTDNRGDDPAAWSAQVSSTNFVSGTHFIPAADAAYATGTLTTTGSGTFTPTDLAGLNSNPFTVAALTGGSGDNTASWNPTITVTLPHPGAVAGTYTATIVHALA
ncbi:MAG: hypothetical protein ACQSGP_17585 [Frankia sp.]